MSLYSLVSYEQEKDREEGILGGFDYPIQDKEEVGKNEIRRQRAQYWEYKGLTWLNYWRKVAG